MPKNIKLNSLTYLFSWTLPCVPCLKPSFKVLNYNKGKLYSEYYQPTNKLRSIQVTKTIGNQHYLNPSTIGCSFHTYPSHMFKQHTISHEASITA